MKITHFPALLVAALCAATTQAQQEPVPKPAAPDTALHVVVDLADGSRLVGVMPADFAIPTQAAELKADIAIKLVKTLTMSPDHKSAELIMQNGDRIEGTVTVPSFPLKMTIGDQQLAIAFVKTLHVFAKGAAAEPGLVFWNTLETEQDALHSEVGPDLVPYKNDGNPGAAEAAREFIADKDGGAITIKGTYKSEQSVRNLVLDGLDKVINPEQGCIELWYFQVARPVGYSYGVYRLFDGDYGLESCAQLCAVPDGIEFSLVCGVRQQGDDAGLPSVSITAPIEKVTERKWVHMAAVWNRKGIAGTKDTIRLYLDGKQVAASAETNWGTTAAGKADICGANDDQCAGKFYMNNVKVWNYDRVNFDLTKPPVVVPKNMPPPVPPPPEDPDAG